jgi:N-acetylneuraminic acid mutarotase
MPTARTHLCAAVDNGIIYALGGIDSSNLAINVVEIYDGGWKLAAPMMSARADFACAALNGKIYAIGGWDEHGTVVASSEVYDPFTNTWSLLAPLPTPRFALAGTVANGAIYTVGGIARDSVTGTLIEVHAVEAYGPVTVYSFSKN